MKLVEVFNLTELGNAPAPCEVSAQDDGYMEIFCESLGLVLYLTRSFYDDVENSDTVFIEFAVNGEYKITGSGKSLQVFSTVKNMLSVYLPKFIVPGDRVVQFAAEKSEPTRVKLYNRVAPIIGSILGNGWEYSSPYGTGSLQTYRWTRKARKLEEKAVQSTWITDLVHNRKEKYVTMRLSNGRQFRIPGITRTIFDRWSNSPSKGQFWHSNIKGNFQVTRIK